MFCCNLHGHHVDDKSAKKVSHSLLGLAVGGPAYSDSHYFNVGKPQISCVGYNFAEFRQANFFENSGPRSSVTFYAWPGPAYSLEMNNNVDAIRDSVSMYNKRLHKRSVGNPRIKKTGRKKPVRIWGQGSAAAV